MVRLLALASSLALCAITAAAAADCPGHPDALGTSRVLTLDPTKIHRVGTMQYPDTLPLGEREIVLTFDDGPRPPSTARILDALRAECVQATFFMLGDMAAKHPDLVRRARAEGHTIANHSQRHQVHGRDAGAAVQRDFESGQRLIAAALGSAGEVAPFYRFPALNRSAAIEQQLAAHGVVVWSADVSPRDWSGIAATEITARVLSGLERKSRGIVVLHDVQPATVRALPNLLRELRARHFRVVHVVPAR